MNERILSEGINSGYLPKFAWHGYTKCTDWSVCPLCSPDCFIAPAHPPVIFILFKTKRIHVFAHTHTHMITRAHRFDYAVINEVQCARLKAEKEAVGATKKPNVSTIKEEKWQNSTLNPPPHTHTHQNLKLWSEQHICWFFFIPLAFHWPFFHLSFTTILLCFPGCTFFIAVRSLRNMAAWKLTLKNWMHTSRKSNCDFCVLN